MPVKQHQHHREFRRLHMLVVGLVIFERLPGAEALFANQQHEGVGLVDPLSKSRLPVAPGSQARVSRPEDFHPRPLAERCVNLSIHTARIR
jgi:hypothetical protein